MKEMLGGCCVCADENGWTDNPLIYCDGPNCEVAVHQGCYGIQEVPEGEWFCAKCNASSSTAATFNPPMNGVMKNGGMRHQFRCGLCPSTFGALKRTDKNGWAHVVCALYIPEVRFGDVHSMEPVILSDVPNDRYDKICYICENLGEHANAKMGACMSCNKIGCKRGFHVTCAQQKGLLCEEGGISKNVKYCGYCENHLRKAQHDPLIKVIPACPVTRGLPPPTTTTDQPTPPPSTNSAAHMLVDPLPRSAAELALGIGPSSLKSDSVLLPTAVTPQQHHNQSSIFGSNTTTFSPPLTTSSRSSVALDTTPPLHNNGTSTTMTSHHLIAGASSETSVGAHLQQIQQAQNAAAAAQLAAISSSTADGLNGSSIYSSVNHVNSYFANELAGRIPANFLPNGDFHLNGTNDLEEKTVKAVLTAPLTKAKRNRPDMIEKVSKRARMNRPNNVSNPMNSSSSTNSSSQSSSATVGKSPSMQRLISLVAPVVSETVSDFQRDRIADRTAAERRAAAAMSAPSTSSNGTSATTINGAAELIGAATGSNGITSNGTASSTTTVSKISQHSTLPSSMEQLLERQWEQGSQLLMSQAHFDVAQLLTCLHQLKTENVRLDEQLAQLTKRLGHLTALNTRLSQPLGPPSGSSQPPQQHLTSPLTSPHHQEPPIALPQPTPQQQQHQQPIINRPMATHAPIVAAAVSTSAQQRTTPSTAGHALSAATPNNLTAATPTTNNTAPPVSSATNFAELAASLSPERLAQLTSASSALNSMYRNTMIDPALLTQLVMNQNYLANPAAVSNSALSSNVLSRIFQQQPQFAAALVNANSLPPQQQPQTPAATK